MTSIRPLILFAVSLIAWSGPAGAGAFEGKYWKILEGFSSLEITPGQEIFDTCSKLTLLKANYIEKAQFIAGFKQDVYDFRVNWCAKATINSVHPQPAFSNNNKELIDKTCSGDGGFIYEVCTRFLGY